MMGEAPLRISFISEGLDGILAGGFQPGEDSADYGDGGGDGPPVGDVDHGQRSRSGVEDDHLSDIGETDAEYGPENGKHEGFPHEDIEDFYRLGAERLQDANFAGALDDRRVHRQKDDQKAHHNGETHDDPDEDPKLGHVVDVELGDKILDRNGLKLTFEQVI